MHGISIHASLAGGDLFGLANAFPIPNFQSTPPSREATISRASTQPRRVNFNPRLPRGRRRSACPDWSRCRPFQSTPPSREATTHSSTCARKSRFQSTPPSREATQRIQHNLLNRAFQSTPPSREATRKNTHINVCCPISIHASLAGGDKSSSGHVLVFDSISIHASLAGGDDLRRGLYRRPHRFQSTPPSREATAHR